MSCQGLFFPAPNCLHLSLHIWVPHHWVPSTHSCQSELSEVKSDRGFCCFKTSNGFPTHLVENPSFLSGL